MSAQLRAFRPLFATQNLAVGTAATAITFPTTLGTMSVRVCNIGTQTVFMLPREAGNATDATATNAIPIPAGQTEVFTLSPGTTNLSLVAGATGSTIYTTLGEGL